LKAAQHKTSHNTARKPPFLGVLFYLLLCFTCASLASVATRLKCALGVVSVVGACRYRCKSGIVHDAAGLRLREACRLCDGRDLERPGPEAPEHGGVDRHYRASAASSKRTVVSIHEEGNSGLLDDGAGRCRGHVCRRRRGEWLRPRVAAG
jgi:hypothetical protein